MAYSLDFRQRVMTMKVELGLTFEQTSARFGVSMAALFRWNQRIEPCKSYKHYVKKLDPNDLLQDVAQYPDAYQRERAERLGVSPSAICQALRKLKISRKKKPTPPKGQRSAARRVSTTASQISSRRTHYY